MIKQIVICDNCNEEIPKVTKKDIFGNENEFYRLGKIEVGNYKVNDLERYNIHLCERCAAKISHDMIQFQIKILMELKK